MKRENERTRLVREMRRRFTSEWRELCAELRIRCLTPKGTEAEYRARRAAEMAHWNHWPTDLESAIAAVQP